MTRNLVSLLLLAVLAGLLTSLVSLLWGVIVHVCLLGLVGWIFLKSAGLSVGKEPADDASSDRRKPPV